MKVLLGEISSYKAIVIAAYLKKTYPNIEVITYDNRKYTNSIRTMFSDEHFFIDNTSFTNYINNLLELIKLHSIDFFLPVHSDYIGLILENKELFGKSLDYIGNYETYQNLHNKEKLLQLADELNIRIPRKYSNFQKAEFPFIGKPKEGSSAEGVVYIFSETDLKKYSNRNFDNYIFQEYIEGIGCGYSVYAENGEIKSGYGHIRLAEFPISGGSSVYRTGFFKREMRDVAEKILFETKWTGFAMFEFKLTPRNEIVLIEVNPRIWGSINQGLQNGVNYFESIFGESENTTQNSKNIKTYLSPQVYLAFLLYVFKGNLKPFLKFIKNIKYNKADISFWKDPKGWLSVILRKII